MKSEFELEKVNEEPAIVYIGSELAGCIFSPEIIVSIDDKTIGNPKTQEVLLRRAAVIGILENCALKELSIPPWI